MNIHEYQAQQLLRDHNIPVHKGEVASNIDEALAVYAKLDSKKVVVKAQVHAGGRGQSGGSVALVPAQQTRCAVDLIWGF